MRTWFKGMPVGTEQVQLGKCLAGVINRHGNQVSEDG